MPHPSKCNHGVYWPAADEINLGCQLCNPDGLGADQATPVLPRSSGDTLQRREEARETCACGNIRTYHSNICVWCGATFPDDGSRGRSQESANRQQAGSCPNCGSSVHFETNKKSMWECSDCGTEYRAPKIAEGESKNE